MKYILFGTGCLPGQQGHIMSGIINAGFRSSASYLYTKLREEAAGSYGPEQLTRGLFQPLTYEDPTLPEFAREVLHIVELAPQLKAQTRLRAIVFNTNPKLLVDYVEDDELLKKYAEILGIEPKGVCAAVPPRISLRL